MAIVMGSCRFGLWHVHVTWQDNLVYRVRFAREGVVGPVPREIQRYCAGLPADLSSFESVATEGESTFGGSYRAVGDPRGRPQPGEIARRSGPRPGRSVGDGQEPNPDRGTLPPRRREDRPWRVLPGSGDQRGPARHGAAHARTLHAAR